MKKQQPFGLSADSVESSEMGWLLNMSPFWPRLCFLEEIKKAVQYDSFVMAGRGRFWLSLFFRIVGCLGRLWWEMAQRQVGWFRLRFKLLLVDHTSSPPPYRDRQPDRRDDSRWPASPPRFVGCWCPRPAKRVLQRCL